METQEFFSYSLNNNFNTTKNLNYDNLFKINKAKIFFINQNPWYKKLLEIFIILDDLKLISKHNLSKTSLFEFGIGDGESGYLYKELNLKYYGCDLTYSRSANISFGEKNCFFDDGINYMKNSKKKYNIIISILFGSHNITSQLYLDFFNNVTNIMNKNSFLIINSDEDTMNYIEKTIFKSSNFKSKFEIISKIFSRTVRNTFIIKLK